MTSIFITGGTGRLGRHVLPLFLRNNYDVVALSRSVNIDGCKMVRGSLHDFDYNEIKGCDWVVHLAANTDMSGKYSTLYNVNVEGTKSLLERCEQAGIKNLLYVSSISVYGKLDNQNITESTPLNPDTPYARTKFEAELLCRNYFGNVCILRPSMIYGSGFGEGFGMACRLIREGRMPIFGDGSNHIPMVHARDVSNAMLLAVHKNAEGVYNINCDDEMTLLELVEYVADLLGAQRRYIRINRFMSRPFLALYNAYRRIKGKEGVPYEFVQMLMYDRVVSSEKARRELGFRARTTLAEGIREFITYLKDSGECR